MNDIIKNMTSRASVKKYKPDAVPGEYIDEIIEAGLWARSGMNRQSPVILVLQDKEQIAYLSKLNAAVNHWESDPFYGAPTVLIVLAEADSPYAVQDGSLVMGNLMNAASALGLGSCWVNRAREVFDSEEGKALLKKWGVEGNYIGIGNCILGYPDEEREMKPRKENYVYYVG